MAFQFRLPDIGEGLEEAEIIEWLVSPGDVVLRDQSLVEVLTDKASSELPSPVAGTVLSLGAAEGERLNVGEVLIELDDGSPLVVDDNELDAPSIKTPPTGSTQSTSTHSPRPKASPATRKLAREYGLDLLAIIGTGPGGRITSEDVRATRTHAVAETAPSSRGNDGEPGLGEMPTGRHPLRGVRGVVARNMEKSWTEIPHIHSMDEIDATLLVDFRKRLRGMDRQGAASITILTVVAAATTRALRRYPMVNSCIEGSPGEAIMVHESVNLGIAVATDLGLVVPVVQKADQFDLFALATVIADLARRGRDGTLTPADLSGATFTITNYGSMGGRWATPLIPPGQAAILGLGSVVDRPIAIDGNVVARATLPIVLGSDHRLIDGDLASAFKGSITADLMEPLNLLVED